MKGKKKLSVLLIVSAMFTLTVSAETVDWTDSDFEYIHENLEVTELQEEINSNQDDIPSFAARIIGDQRMNIYFQETGAVYSAVMDGTEVEQLQREAVEDPTLEVEVNESSVDAIISSESSIEELKNQLDEGGISYEAKTRTNQVKMFITERVVDILSRFSVL